MEFITIILKYLSAAIVILFFMSIPIIQEKFPKLNKLLYPYIQNFTITITAIFSIYGIISLAQGEIVSGLITFLLSAPLCWIMTSIKLLEQKSKKTGEEIKHLMEAGELFLPENFTE